LEKEGSTNERTWGPSGIVISGEPLGSRVLALLLQDSGFQVKFLPLASLSEPGALEGVQLLLLTPTREALSTEERKALVASLKQMPRELELIVIELITLSEERRVEEEEEAQEVQSHKVLWPCSIDELERRIEAALLTAAE
jgi:hypothetical protein